MSPMSQMPASQLGGVDQCNCFTVRKAARQISRMYDSYLQPTGLRVTQFLILAAVNEKGSAAVNELAERLDTERTAMGKMLNTLERDGFVSLQPSPTDGRSRIVNLTKAGRELHKKADRLWRQAQNEFTRLNGAEQVGVLRHSLSEMKTGDVDDAPANGDATAPFD